MQQTNEILTASESERFLNKLVEEIVKTVNDDRLWTIKDIAEYTGYTYSVVYRLIKMPDFPIPIKIIKQPRWDQWEVKAWHFRRFKLLEAEETTLEVDELENETEEDTESFGILKYTKSEITIRELKRIFTRSQDRAKKYSMEHTLTFDEFFKIWEYSNGICAISGVPFSNVKSEGCRRRPFYPSLDRIDSKKGYVYGNVRIVCIIANIARSDFDDGSLVYLAKSIANNSSYCEI